VFFADNFVLFKHFVPGEADDLIINSSLSFELFDFFSGKHNFNILLDISCSCLAVRGLN